MSSVTIEDRKVMQPVSEEAAKYLQALVHSLKNSVEHHREAADKVNDKIVSNLFRELADDRENLIGSLGGLMAMSDEPVDETSSLLGKMRTCWTSFRASLNGGNPTVVLIEAERAEDALMAQFKEVLPEVAGESFNDKLLQYFQRVKSGHDRILAMRNSYQANR